MPELVSTPRKGRPRRRTHRPAMRNVSAQLPVEQADAFIDLCEVMGTSGAAVLREAALAFMAAHRDQVPPSQEGLPLTA